MSNACPFTGYREIEGAANRVTRPPHTAALFRQLRLRHIWPLIKNSGLIVQESWAIARKNHGRFSELSSIEASQYRVPVANFLQRRNQSDIVEAIDRSLEFAKTKKRVCLSQDLLWPCTSEVIRLMLGIPKENWSNYERPISNFAHEADSDPIWGLISRMHSRQGIAREVAKQRKLPQANGLIEHLISYEKNGKRFSNAEIAGCVWMVLGGHISMRYFLSNALNYFDGKHSAQKDFLENSQFRTSAIEELLRVFAPLVQTKRLIVSEFSIGETKYNKGDVATFNWAHANFDESIFENPHEINFQRKQQKHLSFGSGARYCTGAGFARNFIEMFLLRFFEEFQDYRIESSGSVKLKNSNFNGFEKLPADLGV
jgi:cytochrome P450